MSLLPRQSDAELLSLAESKGVSVLRSKQRGGRNPKLTAARRQLTDARVSLFLALLKRHGILHPVREFRFDPSRQWRCDFAWPAHRVALEVEGGAWTNGRHVRGKGYLNDMAKYNRLAVMGWRLLRCTPASLEDEWTITQIREALAA